MKKYTFILFAFLLGLSLQSSAKDINAVTNGRQLFTGEKAFENGGLSCLSCHNVSGKEMPSGGLLAKDLTFVHDRLGDAGITAMLGAPPFPAMSNSYKDRPLTESEITELVAFFEEAAESNAGIAQTSEDAIIIMDKGFNIMMIGGVGGLLVFFLLIHLIWGKRRTTSVKADILNR